MSVTSRLRFFNGQFLVEGDFTDQEDYHIKQRELHGRAQHVWGILEGLWVGPTPGNPKSMRITPGAAIDGLGRHIVLTEPRDVTAPVPPGGVLETYFVVLSFAEVPSHPAPPQYTPGDTRFTQSPTITFVTSVGVGEVVVAQAVVNPAGDIVNAPLIARTYAGVRLPAHGDTSYELRAVQDGPVSSKLAVQRFSPADGSFTPLAVVSSAGHVGIGTTTPGAALEVNGQVKITGGAPGADKVLVSDAGGTGTWKLVETASLATGAVTTAKIGGLQVTSDKLAAGAVTTAKIEDHQVTTDKLATGAVTTAKIGGLQVTSDKLAAGAVTTAKIEDLQVTTGKLANGAVTTAKIGGLQVTTDKIANGHVTPAKIEGGPVGRVLTTVAPGVVGWASRPKSILISASHFNENSFWDGTSFGQSSWYHNTHIQFPNHPGQPSASLFLPHPYGEMPDPILTLYYSLTVPFGEAVIHVGIQPVPEGWPPDVALGTYHFLPGDPTPERVLAYSMPADWLGAWPGITGLLIQRWDATIPPGIFRLYAIGITYFE